MNKPAAKEPSMDEILSSIRQIIADDDAGGVPRRPALSPMPAPRPILPPEPEPEPEPLALTEAQMLREVEESEPEGLSFDDILGERVDNTPAEPEEELSMGSFVLPDSPPPAPRFEPLPVPERSRPAAPMSRAAPLPDPSISEEIAEQLIEPATQAAVSGAFARITNLTGIGTGVTVEQMLREMLKPMLKEWLDENLPSMVERIVEQEIARAARGGR